MAHIFTFHNAPSNFLELIKDAFSPSIFQYIAHFEKLDGLHFESFYYAPVIDELCVMATYSGYEFKIEMAWGGDLDLIAAESVPDKIFETVCNHMKSYRRIGFKELSIAKKRYMQLNA